ncbi:MAG: galactokinase [Acidobacteria bacterium]|nr:galactokinase [Acidobacteriota bacterium]
MAGALAILKDIFRSRFPEAAAPRLFRAPGRVNLIGEHTDYNLGFVLPIAIDYACYTASAANGRGELRVYSETMGQGREWPLEGLAGVPPSGDWSDYPLGVANQLLRAGYDIPAVDLAIHSTLPLGAGLSSSAAIEVAAALALLGGREIEPRELALLARRAENQFVGTPCGIMDQYVCVHGEAGSAIEIDCRDVTHRAVRLPEAVRVVAVNSMVKHELGGSAYVDRVRECSEAVAAIAERFPDVQSLRDIDSERLQSLRPSLCEIPFHRARHVTTENGRVHAFVAAAAHGDLRRMGALFIASHRSLQYDYEVSCAELDFLVDTALTIPGVYGARLTGGGFGGCTVNLVAPEALPQFEERMRGSYQAKFGIDPQIFPCDAAAGAGEIFE